MKDIYSLHQMYLKKETSPVEVLQDCLKIAEKNKLNSYITVCSDLALDQAKKAQKRFTDGKPLSYLDGIPYSLKDLFVTKGIRTTAGSKHLLNYHPPYQGSVAQFLSDSGATLVGKVGCDEFGMGSTNENTPYGAILNPLDPNRVAGGSSGGSAAAVAENSCSFSMGTDTGGSVRLPSFYCGLTGFKPSYGTVTRYGQIAYASSLDQAAPIGRNCLDLAAVMEVISQADPKDSTQLRKDPLQLVSSLLNNQQTKIKLGVDASLLEGCDPDVLKELQACLQYLSQNASIELVDISLPHLQYGISVYYLIAPAEASANLARYDGIHYGEREKAENLEDIYRLTRGKTLGTEVKKRIMLGTFALSSGYSQQFFEKACQVRELIARDFDLAFEKCDYIFSPVSSTKALELKEKRKPMSSIQLYLNDLYTVPVNLAGLPALSLPIPSKQKLPGGFQLIGSYASDAELLKTGYQLEKILEGLS